MCVENIVNIITMLATCILAYAAIRGLGEWKSKDAHNIRKAVLQIIREMKFISKRIGENEIRKINHLCLRTDAEYQKLDDYCKKLEHIYGNLLTDLNESFGKMLDLKSEIELVFSKGAQEDIFNILDKIKEKKSELGTNIRNRILSEKEKKYTTGSERLIHTNKTLEYVDKIVFTDQNNNQENWEKIFGELQIAIKKN